MSLVTSNLKTSVQHLRDIIGSKQIPDDVMASLKSIRDLEKALKNARQTHYVNMERISASRRSCIEAFVNSIPGPLCNVRVYSERDFPVTLSGVDVFPDDNEPFAHKCFIQQITVEPFCYYTESDFSQWFNPYNENTREVKIGAYGFRLKIHFINFKFLPVFYKDGSSNYFVRVGISPKSLEIDQKDGFVLWDIEKYSHMDGSIRYQSISSEGITVEQFKEMLGFNELQELLVYFHKKMEV